jgi:sporulation protein YlmC with PRC-barrel domain
MPETDANTITADGNLAGKVALLIGAAGEESPALALALAQEGADIALVFAAPSAERAAAVQRLVEDSGRQCLIIRQDGDDRAFAARAMADIINRFGRLDLFIDSATVRLGQDGQDAPAGSPAQTPLFPHFQLVLASMDQIKRQKRMSRSHGRDNKQRSTAMKLAQKLKGLPIITLDDGRNIGKVHDIFLDPALSRITALHLGSEGIINRKATYIRQTDVVTLGHDAILVDSVDCLLEEKDESGPAEDLKQWQRLSQLSGRHITTSGGTRIGRLGDVILGDGPEVTGFSLSQTFVTGPVAENSAISRSAVLESESEDGTMIVDLAQAESAELQVVNPNPFTPPDVVPAGEETADEPAAG